VRARPTWRVLRPWAVTLSLALLAACGEGDTASETSSVPPPETGALPATTAAVEAPPTTCDDGRQPVLVALDRGSGERRWATCITADEEHRLVAASGGVAVMIAFGRGEGPDPISLVAFDLDSGDELWSIDGGGGPLPSVAATDDGHFYLLDGVRSPTLDLRAIDPATGAEDWRVEDVVLAAAGDDGVVAFARPQEGEQTTSLIRLDSETGEAAWTDEVTGEFLPGTFLGSPRDVVANRTTVYLTTLDGDAPLTHAIDIGSGEIRWTAPFAASVAGDEAVFGRDGGVEYGAPASGWDADTGERLWQAKSIELASGPYGDILIQTGDLLLASRPTGDTSIVDIRTGEPLWGGPSLTSVWAAAGGALVTEEEETLALLDARSGAVEWAAPVRDPDLVAYVSGVLIDADLVVASIVNNSGA
jgi:outer membrane protein assembly factor BamB